MAGFTHHDGVRLQAMMRRVGRQQWWLRSSGILVTLVLTLGIASFTFPGLLKQVDSTYSFDLGQTIRALVGLVLLFDVYSIYQQVQIDRMQREVSAHIVILDKLEERAEEVYKMALLDPLTELYNRRAGEHRLNQEISRCKREGYPLTVMAFDLNKLKDVNDTFGHAAGDEFIRHFAYRLGKATRGSDVAVRSGGDEFFVLLPECRTDDVRQILQRLEGMAIDLAGKSIPIDFSVGWTNYVAGESSGDLLQRADEILYKNKRLNQEEAKVTKQLG